MFASQFWSQTSGLTRQLSATIAKAPPSERHAGARSVHGRLVLQAGVEDLDISESCLRALVRNNRIPHYRVGKLIRFQPDVLHAWRAAGGTGAEHRAPTIARVPAPVAARPTGRRTTLRRADLPGLVAGSSAAWRSQAHRSSAAGR